MKFSERLKHAMEVRNMKQVDLVEKTGISKGAISQYLSGEFEAKQDRIFLLAKALNIDPAWLMGKDVPMENNLSMGSNGIKDKFMEFLKDESGFLDFGAIPRNLLNPAIRINVYGSIPAGIPIEAVQDIQDWEEIPSEWARGGKEYDF